MKKKNEKYSVYYSCTVKKKKKSLIERVKPLLKMRYIYTVK